MKTLNVIFIESKIKVESVTNPSIFEIANQSVLEIEKGWREKRVCIHITKQNE